VYLWWIIWRTQWRKESKYDLFRQNRLYNNKSKWLFRNWLYKWIRCWARVWLPPFHNWSRWQHHQLVEHKHFIWSHRDRNHALTWTNEWFSKGLEINVQIYRRISNWIVNHGIIVLKFVKGGIVHWTKMVKKDSVTPQF